MIRQRYTARIRFDEKIVLAIPGDDLTKLMATLLGQLEDECTNAMGEIVDNDSGTVVHQCRKQAPE